MYLVRSEESTQLCFHSILSIHTELFESWYSVIGTVTGLWAVPSVDMAKKIISSKSPHECWGPPILLLSEYRSLFLRGKAAGT